MSASLTRAGHRSRSRAHGCLFLAALFLLAGCQTPPLHNMVMGPDYHASNIFRLSDSLPSDFRRVAVLPMTSSELDPSMLASRNTLEGTLQTELLKTKRFELIWIAPDSLQRWTGRRTWDSEEKLPADLFATLREKTACEGILFCRLSRFSPYPPLVIGWNLKLVDVVRTNTLWSADEIFDAAEPAVSNSARRYEQRHEKGGPVTDSPMILNSPQRFGHYTASALLNTMPTNSVVR
jgi:hypothetical protein